MFCQCENRNYLILYDVKVETTKEKIVSLELSTPEAEVPDEQTVASAEAEEDASAEKKPSTNPSNKKRRRKRTKSTDKQS